MIATQRNTTSSLSSVEKALDVLSYIGLHGESELADIAASTSYPKSTLLRLIQTMIKAGYLQRTKHGRYRVTLQVWRIGSGALDQGALRDKIVQILRELVETTGETAHYSVYDNGNAVYIDKIEGVHPIRAYTSVGGRSPAYASATGKALLAWQDEKEIRAVAAAAKKFTPQTVTGVRRILEQAQNIRLAGFAINRGEWRKGVWGIAAPIFGKSRKIEGAIGISGPEDRISARLESYTRGVITAAARITTDVIS